LLLPKIPARDGETAELALFICSFAAPLFLKSEQAAFFGPPLPERKTSELFETMSVDVLELSVPSHDYRHVLVVQDM
jgi:hypothetical protein